MFSLFFQLLISTSLNILKHACISQIVNQTFFLDRGEKVPSHRKHVRINLIQMYMISKILFLINNIKCNVISLKKRISRIHKADLKLENT